MRKHLDLDDVAQSAISVLERLGYEWQSLDGQHYDWYVTASQYDVRDVEPIVRELRTGAFVISGLSPCGGFLQIDQVEADRIQAAMNSAADKLDTILAKKEADRE
jgi:hypothetical protein